VMEEVEAEETTEEDGEEAAMSRTGVAGHAAGRETAETAVGRDPEAGTGDETGTGGVLEAVTATGDDIGTGADPVTGVAGANPHYCHHHLLISTHTSFIHFLGVSGRGKPPPISTPRLFIV